MYLRALGSIYIQVENRANTFFDITRRLKSIQEFNSRLYMFHPMVLLHTINIVHENNVTANLPSIPHQHKGNSPLSYQFLYYIPSRHYINIKVTTERDK
jgi:hypothetical protein